ncbi:MAG: LysM peptidoglycan-binding domain-containing protein [Bdellovibrionales bacterium]|nr:LysM peptidoglycan-binding domain-containing protein [Bdellovibrionales bacterium]
MKLQSFISSAFYLLVLTAPVWLLSCASNDNNKNNNDSGFATLGEEETASDLDAMNADDLELAGASEDMSELENEFEDLGVEEDSPKIAENGAPEELEAPDNSGDTDLDNLLEGGGEASPETYKEENTATSSWDNVPVGNGPRSAVSSNTPQIPSEAFEKGGALLNRYYFARKGDSWGSISQTLYGSGEKSLSLQTWNGRRLRPGKLVFYESPSNRNDSSMVSYYEERGIRPETYALRKGETLSIVAQRQYGDGRSWKEIAGLNRITAPDAVKVGTELMLYPGTSGSSYSPTVAQAEPMPSTPEPEPAAPITQDAGPQDEDYSGFDTAPQAAVPPPVAQTPPPPVYNPPPPPVMNNGRQRFSTARLIQQNLFALAISGIVVVLLIALYVVNKRRKGSAMRQDDLLDEGFAPPRAGRR